MSVQEEKLRAIADAIREKDGTEGPIPAKDFPERIRAISAMPEDMFTISVESSDLEMGAVSGGGIISKGMNAEVTIKAEPGEGYKFVAWQEDGQTVGEGAEYTFTADRDRMLVAAFEEAPTSRLPDGYTELEYISCNGNQGIATDIIPTGSTRVVMSLNNMALPDTSSIKYIIYSYGVVSSNTYHYYGLVASGTRMTVSWTFGTSTVQSLGYFGENPPKDIDFNNNKKIVINGEDFTISSNVTLTANMKQIYLFCSTSLNNGIQSDIYSCQIYEGEEAKRNYVPCTDPNGIAGLYDLVSKTFFGSATATAFLAGPAL